MPSPLGHMLGAVAGGWLVAGAPAPGAIAGRTAIREMLVYASLGAIPDLDLLFGAPSGPTPSVGAAVLVGAAAAAVASLTDRTRSRGQVLTVALACAAAYGSHVLLDWLSSDNSAPIGIMALWPIDRGYYESDLHVFMAISRRYYQGWRFVRQNLLAIARELAILAVILVIVAMGRQRRE